MLKNTVAIIPSLNEKKHILGEIYLLKDNGIHNVVVSIDPKSTDDVEKLLDQQEVAYVHAERSGYDSVMQSGVEAIEQCYPDTEYVLFTSAGGKYDYQVLDHFRGELDAGAEMVMGDRNVESSNLLWHQRVGTDIVLALVNMWFRTNFKDVGPFRVISYPLLTKLGMQPRRFRWTTEMLVKCLAVGADVREVQMVSKKRIGASKITGNIKNSLIAGFDMISALCFVRYTAE